MFSFPSAGSFGVDSASGRHCCVVPQALSARAECAAPSPPPRRPAPTDSRALHSRAGQRWAVQATQQAETEQREAGGAFQSTGMDAGSSAAAGDGAALEAASSKGTSSSTRGDKHRDRALCALDTAGSPYVLLGAATLFALIAWDVFGGGSVVAAKSAHLLPQLVDRPVHAWVQGHIPPAMRQASEKVLSNVPIWAASAGWLGCAAGAVARNPARGSRGVGIAVGALWILTGIGSGRSDILVVDVLKHAFRRVRPSELDHSFAFPSGHTTAAVFFLGALLFVILPLCAAGPDGNTRGGDLSEKQSRTLDSAVAAVQANALALWALGGCITASGRVLADVHWVSDTMAGACLGVFLVSLAANLCKWIRA